MLQPFAVPYHHCSFAEIQPIVLESDTSKERNWTDSELYKLSAFMIFHGNKFQTEKIRKQSKVFAILSKFITTRNVSQCRNYVQKLLSKFKDYDKIIRFFRESMPYFEQNYQKHLNGLKKIIFPLKVASKEMKQSREQRSKLQNLKKMNNQIKEEAEERNQMKPTDISYCGQQQIRQDIERQRKPQLLQTNFPQKSSRSDKEKQKQKRHVSEIMDESYFGPQLDAKQAKVQQKWRDCHKLFIKWTSMTVDLLQKYQKPQRSSINPCF